MNPLYKNAIIAALLFTTTFVAAMILYDFLSTVIRQYIHHWEVKSYLKIQQDLEKALIIAQRNKEAYEKAFADFMLAFHCSDSNKKDDK